MMAAQRRNSAQRCIALVAAVHGGIALATLFAVRGFGQALWDMATQGGGIGAIARGVWQASRLPLSAAWMAGIASSLALLFIVPATVRELRAPDRVVRPAKLL